MLILWRPIWVFNIVMFIQKASLFSFMLYFFEEINFNLYNSHSDEKRLSLK